ncbi:MAG: 2-C-methyl-D-erythritol 4-phosphate cytidylyltransferase [Peptostreptococcus sp.]|uniref:2-C-methyl-D-erythritol 4-phosphate cytidylyltransferase n=1 Tax=Peptostreptococcus sp. TaxID=1262 RepID=UPI002FC5E2C9
MIDAIIVAAGSGKRMNSKENKQFIKIENKPIIIWTLEKFYNNNNIDNITVAIRREDEKEMLSLLDKYKMENIQLVYGGKERQDSIKNCLDGIIHTDYVLIHDGARPFVSDEIIDKCVHSCFYKSCCTGVLSKDTIKIVDKDKIISSTPDRNSIWCAQTPQAFHIDVIKEAYQYAKETGFIATDDASLVENLGYEVEMIEGSYNNIKITTEEDLAIAKYIAESIK